MLIALFIVYKIHRVCFQMWDLFKFKSSRYLGLIDVLGQAKL